MESPIEKQLQFIKDKLKYSEDCISFAEDIIGLYCNPPFNEIKEFHKEWFHLFENNRFICILAPRSHSKTWSIAEYIIYKIVTNPKIRILIVTINQDMADGMMTFIKRHLEANERLIELFGTQQSNTEWSRSTIRVKDAGNQKDPTLKVVGITGGMIGGHYDLIVLDDITDRENSKTEGRRKSLVHQYNNEIMPMLEPNGKVIVCGTKWHQSDIYAYIEKISDYTFKKYQAIIKEPDENGKGEEVLWPERFPYEALDKIRKRYGNTSFMMQYQNEFISDVDAPIKWEWIETARDNYKFLEQPFQTFLGIDLASSGNESDYFSITVIAVKDGLVYVVDGIRNKLTLHGQIEEIRMMYQKWNPIKIGIEQAGPQKIVVEDIQSRLAGFPIIPIKSSSVNDKMARVMRLSVLFETGRIFINPKLIEWIDELASFPRASSDDEVDSLGFALQASLVEEEKVKPIDWSAAAEMISSRKSNVKSVSRNYNFIKV